MAFAKEELQQLEIMFERQYGRVINDVKNIVQHEVVSVKDEVLGMKSEMQGVKDEVLGMKSEMHDIRGEIRSIKDLIHQEIQPVWLEIGLVKKDIAHIKERVDQSLKTENEDISLALSEIEKLKKAMRKLEDKILALKNIKLSKNQSTAA